MDIKHVFSVNPLLPAYQAPQLHAVPPRGAAPRLDRVCRRACAKSAMTAAGFAFDNEGPRHKVWLEPFRLAARPVTCGEYLDFIEDGGYRRPEFWLSDGWATRAAAGLGGAALLALRGRRVVASSRLSGRAPARTRPSRSAMSAFTRPTPSPDGPASGCRPKRNGRSPPRVCRWPAISPIAAIFTLAPTRRRRRRTPNCRGRCSAMSGNGPPAPMSPIRAFGRLPGADRRIQRQVHVQPDGAARRRGGDPGRPYAGHLSQFLPALGALGLRGAAAGGGSLMMNERRALPFMIWRPARRAFATPCWPGSAARRKAMPCKFFYDARGSALFEEICRLPEYYPTRTEIAILEEICRRHRGSDGAALPADRVRQRRQPQGAHPAARARPARRPMSRSTSRASICATPRRSSPSDFPSVPVIAVCADYTRPFPLPPLPGADRQAGRVFPGLDDRQFRAGRRRRASFANYAELLGPRRRDADRRRSEEGRRRFSTPPITTAPGSTPRSTSTCWNASTASSTAISISTASSTSPSTTPKRAGWSSTSKASPIRRPRSPAAASSSPTAS